MTQPANVRERSPFVTTGDGVRLAYRLDGAPANPILVLANSIGTSLHMWDRQIPEFTAHFRVLRYDFRGHGSSDVPVGAYSLDRLGRDVLELMDGLGVAKAHFLGLSLGGFVGQWLGIHAPERIDHLILANTAAHLGPPARWDDAIANVLAAADMRGTAETFLRNWFPARFLADDAPVVEEFRAMLLDTSREGIAGAWAAVRDADLRRAIALIRNPTLVIAGQHDTVTDLSHARAVASRIPEAKLLVLPVVHLSNVESPRAFTDAVIDFLRTAPAVPADR
jgi:3-oxoadipate enol-lactonase